MKAEFRQDTGRGQAVVLGCGNVLFGDDGFGPAVIERLSALGIPPGVVVEDAGTGVRLRLFDFMVEAAERPRVLIVVDTVDLAGLEPGQIVHFRPERLWSPGNGSFDMHRSPTIGLLAALERDTGMDVWIVAVQAGRLPSEVEPGLSKAVAEAVGPACSVVMRLVERFGKETGMGAVGPVSVRRRTLGGEDPE